MTKKSLIVASAGVLALVAAGGAAYAAKERWHGRGHGGPMFNLTERYDADKNGLVTQDEINTGRSTNFAKFDSDKSGNLSLTEFQALWVEAHKERMVREFQHFDENGDSNVTLDEYKKPLATIVADMDQNGDNALGRDDRPHRQGGKHHRHGMGHGDGQGTMGDDAPTEQ